MKSTPTIALEVLLNIEPIDLFIASVAAKSAVRLYLLGHFKQRGSGHRSIEIGNLNSDYRGKTLNFSKTTQTFFPSREDWQLGLVEMQGEIAVYTDGSKTSEGTGSGIYIQELECKQSINLQAECSVFQAEVLAIRQACKVLISKGITDRDISIYVDSQAALKSLSSIEVKSHLVITCKENLETLSNSNNVRLCWVPGHENIRGNEEADLLARNGSASIGQLNDTLGDTVKPPICSAKRKLDIELEKEWERRWVDTNIGKVTRFFCPTVRHRKADRLLRYNKKDLRLYIGFLTGHCLLRKHAKRIGLAERAECRYCQDIHCDEDVEHIICECPALMHSRTAILGSNFLNRHEMSEIDIKDICKFVKRLKCFEQNEN